MNNLSINLLSEEQVKFIFREELKRFFENNQIVRQSEMSKIKIVDLDGLMEARPMVGSRSTIYKKVSKGEIPHSKSGKRLIFDLNVIDEWLLSNQIKTSAAIQAEAEQYVNNGRKKRRLKGLR